MTVLVHHPDDAALLQRVPTAALGANGVPDQALAADRIRGAALVADVLKDHLFDAGLRTSPLGPAWSRDLDCHVRTLPPSSELLEAGWVPLDGLLRQLRLPGQHRWAVTYDGRVLAAVDLELAPPPPPLEGLLDRCRRRGEIRLRELLELRHLHRSGTRLPADEVVALAADVEHGLGGSSLKAWRTGTPAACPAALPVRAPRAWQAARGRTKAVRNAARPRIVVALSGVDGAGKSSVAAELAAALQRAGIPHDRVWARPGMSVGSFSGLRRRLKRLLGEEGDSGMRQRAADPEARLTTRTGVLGFAWSLLVTASFLWTIRRQHLRSRGVVIYDRHVVDALVTLDLVYGGTDLRLHRFLIRRLLPAADVAFFLDVSPEVSAQRQPDDFFSLESLRRQVDEYYRRLHPLPDVHRLPSDQPPTVLARTVLDHLL